MQTKEPQTSVGGIPRPSKLIWGYLIKYKRPVLIGLAALLLVDGLELVVPILLKRVVDELAAGNATQKMMIEFAAIYFGISVVQSYMRYLWRMYLVRASMLAGRDLRYTFMDHLFGLSPSFFDRAKVGDLISLSTNDTEAVRMALGPGLLTFADVVFYFLTVPVMMIWLSPYLALLLAIPLLSLPFWVSYCERRIRERFEKVQESFGKLSALAQENMSGIRLVRAFANEAEQIERFKTAGQEYMNLSLNLARIQSRLGPVLELFLSIGTVILILGGGWAVLQGAVSLGTFVAFQRYMKKLVWPMTAVGLVVTYLQRGAASSKRIEKVLSLESDLKQPTQNAPGELAPGPRRIAGEILFNRLTFSYPNAALHRVLDDVSLRIQPGQRVGVLGSIGSGKSTLLSLVAHLYPIQRGQLQLDGVDINDWDIKNLRSQLAYVSQEPFLFSATLAQNVRLGSRNSQLALDQCLKSAALFDDVEGFLQGTETPVGERGVTLSGGQKQRLALARAISREAPVMLLDDALSSVDIQTEKKIVTELKQNQMQKVILLAAQRISTIKWCDQIVVLDRGKIVQQGTHRQLVRQKGTIYRRYCQMQKLQEEFEHELIEA